ncbi:DUF2306 domain-containing protein [Beijerinckia indica]|uniref:DUF2306 domain-containing protein n=1 Tax=Beijerinckia indica subsp. indica (strain ATCC 9039 / DSM 1715 / NCIMB 8712) TaxID=395963 RepID=B2IDJ8_BEII9|nr:DUF2306 domain-containing protein [Beijerinckia indica]ACB95434.1 conserved hypothetical protein [Beijerinckia indica subsp. indica ATCC 9039]
MTTSAPFEREDGLTLKFTGWIVGGITWVSAAIFGLYIIAFYGGAVQIGQPERWNEHLPALFDPASPSTVIAIGVHFVAGTILLLAGPVQLIPHIRNTYPAIHRWLGRTYVGAGFISGLGGLAFILMRGTIGGLPMNIGFGLYGALMILASVETYRHAAARRLEQHRAWAIRLFALAIGSWLYRMEYGLWFALTDPIGHTKTFDGWFDIVMSFFFYVPNLIVAELLIRGRNIQTNTMWHLFCTGILTLSTVFVAIGTYFFTTQFWGPQILAWLRTQ